MGRQINCLCRLSGQDRQVTALLESTELVLRGDVKHRIPLASMESVHADAAGLHFTFDHEAMSLLLPEREAASWAKKIGTSPPSLREKLGLGADARAFVAGPADAPELAAALDGVAIANPAGARMLIAVVADEAALRCALSDLPQLPPGSPVWVVHGKGRGASFGETAVRTFMRATGFIDTKVAAVSATLTATRYSKAASR